MLAWRLRRERYAKLDPLGAAKVGGRWNPAGSPMVCMRGFRRKVNVGSGIGIHYATTEDRSLDLPRCAFE